MRFNYKTLQELRMDLEQAGLDLPTSQNVAILGDAIQIGGLEIPNRLATHPMEGCDGLEDGSPGELTLRRYERFARGGAGLIWFEAVAVNSRGRSNPAQLHLKTENLEKFKKLVDQIRAAGLEANGYAPFLVLQLTHSGRFGIDKQIVSHCSLLDERVGLGEDFPVMTDSELDSLANDYLHSAQLGAQAGFDAVDIKGCHRYLLSELLGAHAREGRYGGAYENRTRFIKEVIKAIQEKTGIETAIRLNSYDAIPLPNGWGCDEAGEPDLREPIRFVQELEKLGVSLFNITASTPYLTPHISRPYDQPGQDGYVPPERPLVGVSRLLSLAALIQREIPHSVVIGTGFSWLRHLAPYVGAGLVEKAGMSMVGFGRGAFAYPNFANDILQHGEMKRNQACITCSKCAELKARGLPAGCVVRDPEVYLPVYRKIN